ncbi:hypothetical protein JCM11641_004540 [Rhodosporidiobolus odoratus]
MREPHPYHTGPAGRQSPYPSVSAPACDQAYPADGYPPTSSSSTPMLDYRPSHQAPRQQAHLLSYAPLNASRSPSGSSEESALPAAASTFVLPSSYHQGSVSPVAHYQQPYHQIPQSLPVSQPSPNLPSLSSSFFAGTPSTASSAAIIYRDRVPQAQPHDQHHQSQRRAGLPAGQVGGPEGWPDHPLVSPAEQYPSFDFGHPTSTSTSAPAPALSSASLTRQNSGTAPAAAAVKGKAAKAAKNAAPRKRVAASCKPCRAKKLRCDRALPCSSCVERGDPQGCMWEGDAKPLYIAREENDTKELKAQVDRLQHLLDALSQRSPSLPSGSGCESSLSSRARMVSQASASPPDHFGSDDEQAEEATFDLHAQDLAEALSELMLNGVMPAQICGSESFAPGGGSGQAFVKEAEQFLLTFTQRLGLSTDFPFTVLTPSSNEPPGPHSPDIPMRQSHLASSSRISSPSALGLSAAVIGVRPSVSHLLDLLSSEADLKTCYKFYVNYVHWYSSPLNLPAIDREWPTFSAALIEPDQAIRGEGIDPLFIATVLGAAASGLASMTNAQAQKPGFPEDRSAIVEQWVRAAMLALVVGRFMERPSVEGIRAALVLASLYIEQFMTTGETVAAGMSLLSLAVHAAFQLNLHRDPAMSDLQLSFAECEDRRRLFWCLFTLCMSITTGTSRTWLQFDLRQIDTRFPLDCYDAELLMDERAAKARIRGRLSADTFEETPMTSSVVRAQYALLVKKITDTAFSTKPCKYTDILALDAELRAFEKSFPPVYNLPTDDQGRVRFSVPPTLTEMRCALIQLCLSAEFVRLHRPFLVLAASDDQYQHSREQTVKYAKRILAINATPGCNLNWAGHNLKVLSAAIVLGLEILQSPTEPDADIIRSMVDVALQQAELFAAVSSVCRKGAGVVRFLLKKVDEDAASLGHPRSAKRARTVTYSPEAIKLRRPLAASLGATDSTAISRSASPSRRRKPTRPPLLHVQSDTVVARVQSSTAASAFAASIEAQESTSPMFGRGSRSHSADNVLPTLATECVSPLHLPQQPTYHRQGQSHLNISSLAGLRSRTSNRSFTSSSSSGFAQARSSPELSLSLPLPPQQSHFPSPSHQHKVHHQQPHHPHQQPLHLPHLPTQADSFMHYAAGTSSASLTSGSSLFDEHDVQSFFSLPAQVAGAAPEDQLQVEGRGRSRFNEPVPVSMGTGEGEDFYQHQV